MLVRRRNQAAGFTLIEILVVVSVMAIIVSIALLSLGVLGDDRPLRREAQRIISLLAAAQDEAVMQGREFGFEVMRGSYRFVEYDPFELRWLEVQTDDIFRRRDLPDDMEFGLLLEDRNVLLKTEAQDIEKPESAMTSASKNYSPHVMIFSSGELTPFELRIAKPSQDQMVILHGDVLGKVEVMSKDEQADALRR